MRSTMPDSFFRDLNAKEEAEFRQWAQDHWTVWHPVVRDEIRKIVAAEIASGESK